jgi:hypothetical protein
VVVLCTPEGLGRLDFGDNPLRLEAAFGGELLNFSAGLRLLLGRVEEDGRAVLRSPVRTLAIEGRGVVEGKECVSKLSLLLDRRGRSGRYRRPCTRSSENGRPSASACNSSSPG